MRRSRWSEASLAQARSRGRGGRPGKRAGHLGLSTYLYGLRGLELEYRFAAPRRWRFDAALPQYKVAIEQEGGIWTHGRHTRGKGYIADLEKYNEAVQRGWRVLRFTPEQVRSGEALDAVHRLLNTVLQP